MTHQQKTNGYAACVSLTLHLFLALLIVAHFTIFSKSVNVNTGQPLTIHSYVSLSQNLSVTKLAPTTTHTIHQTTSKQTMPINPDQTRQTLSKLEDQTSLTTATTITTPITAEEATTAKPAATSDKTNSTLLTQLHNAIQAQQVYPNSALTMKRQGRASVSFTLAPDGSITHLQLAQSSGTNSLDQAALTAVTQASPFQGIRDYLSQAQDFTIDVVFTLPPQIE